MNDEQHPTHNEKTYSKIAFVALGLVLLVLGVFVYWVFTGRDVITYDNKPFPVKPEVVKTDGYVTINANFCKTTKVEGRVVRRFVSSNTELLAPTVTENLKTGCYKNIPILVPIPAQIVPGRYHINYRITYQTNPLHNITEELNTKEFEVVE